MTSIIDCMHNDNFNQHLHVGKLSDNIADDIPLFDESDYVNENNNTIDNIMNNMPINKVKILLDKCLEINGKNRPKAKEAVQLIKEHLIFQIDQYLPPLVKYPDVLIDVLDFYKTQNYYVSNLDTFFEFCVEFDNINCIEESIAYLLDYKGDKEIPIRIIDDINLEIYRYLKQYGIYDKYYDDQQLSYHYPNAVHRDTTYRAAYHMLMYGGTLHYQSLIVHWDLYGDDDTTDAARDFFKLAKDTPIQTLKQLIDKK